MEIVIPVQEIQIQPCIRNKIKDFIQQHHYSHNINGVKSTYCFEVLWHGRLVGAVLFGQMSTTAWKKFGSTEREVLELRRLVLLDEVGRNSESHTVGYCLRWIKANAPEVNVVVSYADPNYGHVGTIYRASNFEYLGLSAKDAGYRDLDTKKLYHSRALRTKYKGKYKPFVIKLRDKLAKGRLEKIVLQGKHCFVYQFQRKCQDASRCKYCK